MKLIKNEKDDKKEMSMTDIHALDIWNTTMNYTKKIGMLYYDKYIPPYLASIGGHVGNLRNYGLLGASQPFSVANGRINNLRVNIMMVAPAGFSKSLIQDIFLSPSTGILYRAIPTKRLGTITSAGLVGSVNPDGTEIMGIAQKYNKHIVGIEEFSAISEMMRQGHSAPMLAEILKITDSGSVQKSIKNMDVDYETQMTFWLGVQNALYDAKSGFHRRFVYIDASPSEDDIKKYKEARINGRGKEPDLDKIIELRQIYREFYTNFVVEGEMLFSSNFEDYIMSLDTLHSEDALLEKVAIGYFLLKNYEGGDVEIDLDDGMKKLFDDIIDWRKKIILSGNNAIILNILKNTPDGLPLKSLEEIAIKLGMNRNEFMTTLNTYIMEEKIRKEKIVTKNKGRPSFKLYLVGESNAD